MTRMSALQFAARVGELRLSPPIQAALQDIMVHGRTWSQAVADHGVSRSGVLRAMRRVGAINTCPHCGRPIHGRDVRPTKED